MNQADLDKRKLPAYQCYECGINMLSTFCANCNDHFCRTCKQSHNDEFVCKYCELIYCNNKQYDLLTCQTCATFLGIHKKKINVISAVDLITDTYQVDKNLKSFNTNLQKRVIFDDDIKFIKPHQLSNFKHNRKMRLKEYNYHLQNTRTFVRTSEA